MPENNSIARLVVDSLIANGIKHLYCVPGVQNDDFFNALYDRSDAIAPIQTRHEQGAAYMALGAALATGKPQAFSLVPGPGFLNGCAALSTAYALNAPVFGIIGQIPSGAIGKGIGHLHEIEGQLDTLDSLTKHADRIVSPLQARDQLRTAWSEVLNGRPRPVGLEIPVDCWLKPVADIGDLVIKLDPPPTVDDAAIAHAATMIRAAKNPIIFVGGGAQNHSEAIRAFAGKINAPVTAFRTGHGVMPSNDGLSIATPVAHALWKECDLAIGLGSRIMPQRLQWGLDSDISLLHIDIDSSMAEKSRDNDHGICGDLTTALPALYDQLEQIQRIDWIERIDAEKKRFAGEIAESLQPQLSWLQAIRDSLSEDGIFVDELTQIGYVSRFAFPSYQPRTFLSTMFGIAELATAKHHNIAANFIVMKDNAYGNVRSIQRDKYDARYIASDLSSPDFVMLAQSCGVQATRAESPDALKTELAKAIAHNGPNLIEVPVGEFPSPWQYILLPKVRG